MSDVLIEPKLGQLWTNHHVVVLLVKCVVSPLGPGDWRTWTCEIVGIDCGAVDYVRSNPSEFIGRRAEWMPGGGWVLINDR